MKKFKNKFSYAMILLATILFISCSGDDGAIGPTGENGQDGKDGINGVDGIDGQDGKDGNANVIASGWITNPVFGKEGLGTSFPIANNSIHFNETNRDSGLIMVYGKSGTTAVALPITLDRSTLYSFSIISPVLRIGISSSKASITIKYNNFTHFRYVVISAVNTNANVKNQLKDMSYTEAMDFLELSH